MNALHRLATQIELNTEVPAELRKHLVGIIDKIQEYKDTKKVVILTDVSCFEDEITDQDAVSSAIECQAQGEWNDDNIAIVNL